MTPTETKPKNHYREKIRSSESTVFQWTGSYVEFLRQLAGAFDEGVKAGRQAEREERELESCRDRQGDNAGHEQHLEK